LVIQEVYNGLENLLYSISLDQILDEIQEALEDKALALKTNLLVWLQKIFSSPLVDQFSKSAKQIVLIVKKILMTTMLESGLKLLNC
jgi:hypothetical protein